MKRALVVLFVFAWGCAIGPELRGYSTTNAVGGDTIEAMIGAPLVIAESGTRYAGYPNAPPVSTFTKQLIYGGLSGSTLRFTYREFSNSLARPAFSQELQYDIAQSKVIAFRDLRLRVISATNERISAEVLLQDGEPVRDTAAVAARPAGRTTCAERSECGDGMVCVQYHCQKAPQGGGDAVR